MKHLVKHLWEEHQHLITSRSLLNCHVKGLHSIMLIEKPEHTVRLYIAEPGNELWMNRASRLEEPMSLSIHPHHCDITIEVVHGILGNRVFEETTIDRRYTVILDQFKYESAISSGKGKSSFKLWKKDCYLSPIENRSIPAGQAIFLKAEELHTVYCDPNNWTAWFVYEGKEDRAYQNIAYSNQDLTQFDSTGLYIKPTVPIEVEFLLEKVNLL